MEELLALLRPDIILFLVLAGVAFGYGHVKGKNALISLSLASLVAFLVYLLLPDAWVTSFIPEDPTQAFYARTLIVAVITGVLHFWVLRRFVVGDGWGLGKVAKLLILTLAWAIFAIVVLYGLGLESVITLGTPFTALIDTGLSKIVGALILIGGIAVGK